MFPSTAACTGAPSTPASSTPSAAHPTAPAGPPETSAASPSCSAEAGSAADQPGGADGGGESVAVAGARVHVGRGVGEFDHVLVAVLDGPGKRLLGRLRPGGRARQLLARGRCGGRVDSGQRSGRGPRRG